MRLAALAEPGHPDGVRAVGGLPRSPPPVAIANAIYDAIGIRPGAPPFSSEKIYLLMQDAGIVE